MDKNLERILMLAEKDEYDNGGHFDEANEMEVLSLVHTQVVTPPVFSVVNTIGFTISS